MAGFRKGQSGNPKGRPPGTSQAAKLRQAIENDVPDIIRAMVSQAKSGDTAAANLLLARVFPALKSEALPVSVAGMDRGTLTERATAALDAAANGDLAPDVAASLVGAVGTLARVVEIDELERRVAALEQRDEKDPETSH